MAQFLVSWLAAREIVRSTLIAPPEAGRFEQLTTVRHVAVLGRLFTHRGGA